MEVCFLSSQFLVPFLQDLSPSQHKQANGCERKQTFVFQDTYDITKVFVSFINCFDYDAL